MKPIIFSTERGQALILITLAAIGLFAIAGLAIDGSAHYADRRHAQNAADSAALAGALELVRKETPNPDTWDIVARNMAKQNGYDGNLVKSEMWVYKCSDENVSGSPRFGSPADCGPYEDKSDYIQVAITTNVNTYFARVIGINQTHNTVQAIARAQTDAKDELYGGGSMIGLAQHECKTIWFSGSAQIDIKGGGVHSNSDQKCGVTIQGGNGFGITTDGSINMVAADKTVNGTPPLGGVAGGFYGGASPYEYPPPAHMLPNISCGAATAAPSGTSMSPGNWSGTFPPSGVTTLNPGTYCINGNFKLNAHDHLSGTGVTIFMQSGEIDWNGGAEINLSAPSSGDLQGMLIYAPMSNTNTMKFNGNASTTLTGTVYMPAAPIIYNGTGNLNPSHVQVIGYTIEITGSNTTNILYQDSDNWDWSVPAVLGIMQ